MKQERTNESKDRRLRSHSPRIGSLCTGYGGLDMAVLAVFGGRLAWCADNDKHVATILAARYPGVPNLGDLAQLEWSQVDPVDIICTGFPCQDISCSGKGAGIEKGVRSGIWRNIIAGIRILRPKLIFVENVAAIRSRGLDRVLGDLAGIGYDAVWTSLRASDVGAPHGRERVFILGFQPEARDLLLAAHALRHRSQRQPARVQAGCPGPSAPTLGRSGLSCPRQADHSSRGQIDWGRYEPAIRRWEALTGRVAPYPIVTGAQGQPRLAPALSEWMMGLPRGFVTDLDLSYSAQHRAVGNGVVPHQAVRALQELVALAVNALTRDDKSTVEREVAA